MDREARSGRWFQAARTNERGVDKHRKTRDTTARNCVCAGGMQPRKHNDDGPTDDDSLAPSFCVFHRASHPHANRTQPTGSSRRSSRSQPCTTSGGVGVAGRVMRCVRLC